VKYKILLILLVVTSIGWAHQAYQAKSYTFQRFEHVIDVNLDENNTLSVNVDAVEIGTRTDFCTALGMNH